MQLRHKRQVRLLAIVGLFVLGTAAGAGAAVSIVNPGFETDDGGGKPLGWGRTSNYTGTVFSRDQTIFRTGASSGSIYHPGGSSYEEFQSAPAAITPTPGDALESSVWQRSATAGGLVMTIVQRNASGSGTFTTCFSSTSPGTSWQELKCRAGLLTTSVTVQIVLGYGPRGVPPGFAPGTIWFDDVSVSQVPGGLVEGHLRDAVSGAAVPYVNLDLSSNQCDNGSGTPLYRGYAFAGADGYYQFSGVPAGVPVYAKARQTGAFLAQYWNGKETCTTADPIVVAAAGQRTTADFNLVKGGTISGTVTNAGGGGIQNVSVGVYALSGGAYPTQVGYGTTNASGAYSVAGLASGTSYKVQFNDYSRSYVSEWYDNAASFAAGTPVAVIAGSDTPNINASLDLGAAITGVIHAPGLLAGNTVYIAAYGPAADPANCWNRPYLSGTFVTADGGTFTIKGLAAGPVFLYVSDSYDAFASQWWNGAFTCTNATAIDVVAGGTYTGKDVTLAAPVSVSGTVRNSSGKPVAGAQVAAKFDACALPDNRNSWSGRATTNTDGTYTIEGLPPTSLFFVSELPGRFKSEYWNGTAGTGTKSCGSAVAANLGAVPVPAIDFSLDPWPQSPKAVSADSTAAGVALVWEASSTAGISGYNVYRQAGSASGYTRLGSTAGLTHTDAVAVRGESYAYKVLAYDADGESFPTEPPARLTVGAPRPPTGLAGVSGTGRVDLSWAANKELDIAHYNVYRKVAEATGFTRIANDPNLAVSANLVGAPVSNAFRDEPLPAGSVYSYALAAVDNEFAGLVSPPSQGLLVAANGLQVPPGLTATPGNGQVLLDWADVGAPRDHYVIYRMKKGGAYYESIATNVVSNYTDLGVVNGATYQYLVGAVDAAGGLSVNLSTWVSATPGGPAAPTGLVAGLNGSKVTLDWADNSPAGSGYRVYRSVASGSGYTRLGSPLASAYTDTLADPNNVYFYRVTALAGAIESGYSTEARFAPSPGNKPPTLDPIAPVLINEDAPQRIVNLTGIAPGAGETQTLTVTAKSSATGVIPNPTVSYTSPGTTGNIKFTPVANANGTATITVTVNDGQPANNTVVRTFLVTVNTVNDSPTFTKGKYQVALEDAGMQTITGWATGMSAGPADEAGQALDFILSNDNNALFAAQPALSAGGTLTFKPAPDANGNARVTVQLHDNGGMVNGGVDTSAPQSFSITVTAVNDPPTLVALAPRSISEDAPQQSVALSGISAGGGESQPLTVTASSSNPGLIPHPSVSYTSPNALGSLTFTPVANATGTATVTVSVSDGQVENNTVTRTFLVTVNPVNDAPTGILLSSNLVSEGAPAGTTVGTLSTVDADSGDAFTYSIVAGDTTMFRIEGNLLKTNQVLDYTVKNPYTVRIRSTDSGLLGTERDAAVGPPAFVLWSNGTTGKAVRWKVDPVTGAMKEAQWVSANAGAGAGWKAGSYERGATTDYVLWTHDGTGRAVRWDIDRVTAQYLSWKWVSPKAGYGAGWQASSYARGDAATDYVLWTHRGTGMAFRSKIDPATGDRKGSQWISPPPGVGAGWEAGSYERGDAATDYVLWTNGTTGKAVRWKIDPVSAALKEAQWVSAKTGVGAGWQASSYARGSAATDYVLWTNFTTGKAVRWQIDPVSGVTTESIWVSPVSGAGAGWGAASYFASEKIGAPVASAARAEGGSAADVGNTILVRKAGGGAGTISFGAERCGPECDALLLPGAQDPGSVVVVPEDGSRFGGWETTAGQAADINAVPPEESLIAVFELE